MCRRDIVRRRLDLYPPVSCFACLLARRSGSGRRVAECLAGETALTAGFYDANLSLERHRSFDGEVLLSTEAVEESFVRSYGRKNVDVEEEVYDE